MKDYEPFDIRLDRTEAGTYKVYAEGLKGRRASGLFQPPLNELELENFALSITRTARGARSWSSPPLRKARDMGSALFQELFQEGIREIYRESIAAARDAGKGLRVTLHLSDAPALMHLPWEYLCDGEDFLCLSEQTPMVRYLDVSKPYKVLTVKPPLKLLGMISSPTDVQPLDVEREKANLENALSSLTNKGLMSITWLEQATFPALNRELAKDNYHVFHYIGHGGYDSEREDGLLVLEDRHGRSDPIMGSELAVILGDEAPLRLAVLNACQGARTSSEDPFAGVAASLVRRDVPAVIAMQFDITDEAAIVFSEMLYTALVGGHSVDAAVAVARRAIFAEKNYVEWGTPVLFMRVPDGCIFDIDSTMSDAVAVREPRVPEVPATAKVADAAPAEPQTAPPDRVPPAEPQAVVPERAASPGEPQGASPPGAADGPAPQSFTLSGAGFKLPPEAFKLPDATKKHVPERPDAGGDADESTPAPTHPLMPMAAIENIARSKLPSAWFWGGTPGEIALLAKHVRSNETVLEMAIGRKQRMTPGVLVVTDRRFLYAWKGALGGEEVLEVALHDIQAVDEETSFWSTTGKLMISTRGEILKFDNVLKAKVGEIRARLKSMMRSP